MNNILLFLQSTAGRNISNFLMYKFYQKIQWSQSSIVKKNVVLSEEIIKECIKRIDQDYEMTEEDSLNFTSYCLEPLINIDRQEKIHYIKPISKCIIEEMNDEEL